MKKEKKPKVSEVATKKKLFTLPAHNTVIEADSAQEAVEKFESLQLTKENG